MIKEKIQSQKGFSLVEVMISFGLIGLLSLYVAKLSTNINKVTLRLESKVDEVQFLSQVHQTLANPISCTRTLGTYCKNHSGERVSPEECPSEFYWGSNLKGKVISDGTIPLTPSSFNDIRSNSVGVSELYLSENHRFMATSCELLRAQMDHHQTNGIRSLKAFAGLMKKVFLNDAMAAMDASDLKKEFHREIPILDLVQVLPPIIFDFSWLFKLDCKGKFSDKLFVTNVRVAQLESEIPNVSYNLDVTEYSCSTSAGDQCAVNHSTTWGNLRNSYQGAICPASETSTLLKYSCNDFVENTQAAEGKLGQIVFYVEYKIRSDNTNNQDRRRSKVFVVPAQSVPMVNGHLSGAPNSNGVYISRCGTHIGEYKAPKDFYHASSIDPDLLTLLKDSPKRPPKTDRKKLDIERSDFEYIEIDPEKLPM